MMTFIMIIHGLVCVLLACIVLMQSGRGGGLTESFASAESIFGAQTNVLLVKSTTILASIFLVTCLSLAVMHSMKGKSLMSDRVAVPVQTKTNLPADSTNPVKAQAAQAVATVEAKTDESANKAVAEINQAVAEVEKIAPPTENSPVPAAAQPVPVQ